MPNQVTALVESERIVQVAAAQVERLADKHLPKLFFADPLLRGCLMSFRLLRCGLRLRRDRSCWRSNNGLGSSGRGGRGLIGGYGWLLAISGLRRRISRLLI